MKRWFKQRVAVFALWAFERLALYIAKTKLSDLPEKPTHWIKPFPYFQGPRPDYLPEIFKNQPKELSEEEQFEIAWAKSIGESALNSADNAIVKFGDKKISTPIPKYNYKKKK